MFFKQFVTTILFFITVLHLCIAQTPPKVEIDEISISNTPLTYGIVFTIFDTEVDSIEQHIRAYSIEDTAVNIPFTTYGLPPKIKTGEQRGFDIQFNADSLAKYNVDQQDIGISIIAHKPVSENTIAEAINNVNETTLEQYMFEVEGVRHSTVNPTHYLKVQNMFDSLSNSANFKNLNYTYPFGSTESKNLIALKAGIIEDTSSVLLTAHYDTVEDSPGADDNGSGVCGLFMAMKILKEYSFEKNIKIVGFDDEEAGLVGSFNYIANGIAANEQIAGVFNFEMIGYASDESNTQELPIGFDLLFPDAANYVKENDFRGDFLICVGNTTSTELISDYEKAAAQYVPNFKVLALVTPGNGEITQDLRRSDHSPFWDNGYQALMLTDGANFRNPFYHTPNDLAAVLDFEFMANVTKVTIAAAMLKAKPIVYAKADGLIKDAVVVAINDIENSTAFDLALFNSGHGMQIFYQLPIGIKEAILKIYNLNGQFLEDAKINMNKGRLNLLTGDNLNQFAIVMVEVDGEIRYAKKVIMFP